MGALFSTIDGAIGVITLENGKVNALSKSLLDDITSALAALPSSPVRVVILRAPSGSKVFSAGHDVNELPTNGRDPLTYSDPLRQVVRAIELCHTPVIAMVEGSVWGGACELVLGCDLIVAANDSTFALTPARLGVPYNVQGALNFMKVAGSHLLKEMLFTADPIPAARLEAYGVVNHVVAREDLESFTIEMARPHRSQFSTRPSRSQGRNAGVVQRPSAHPGNLRAAAGPAARSLRQHTTIRKGSAPLKRSVFQTSRELTCINREMFHVEHSPSITTVPCPRDFVIEPLNLGAGCPRSRFETWESTKLHSHTTSLRRRRPSLA